MSDNNLDGGSADDSGRALPLGGHWRKSSLSMSNGDCVEVAPLARGHVGVRDSKAIVGPYLRFSPGVWTAFVGDIRRARSAGRNLIS